jgi:DNA-binding CsgD family transcriptional regulator
MDGLRERDIRAFVEVAHDAARVARAEPRRFGQWALTTLGRLVPSDGVWQLQSGPAPGRLGYVEHVESDNLRIAELRNGDEGRAAWARLADDFPLRQRRARWPLELRAMQNSDLSTLREFRRTESYDVFFRPFGLDYVATVGYRGSRVFHLVCGRQRVDYTARELLLLDVLAAVLGPAVRDPPPPPPRTLVELGVTIREADVLARVAAGRSNHEIADDLVIAPGTVKKHLDNLFAKLGVRNRVQAARAWLDASETPPPPSQ